MMNVSEALENIKSGGAEHLVLTDLSSGRRLWVGAHFFSLASARRCRPRAQCERPRALPLHAAAHTALPLLG